MTLHEEVKKVLYNPKLSENDKEVEFCAMIADKIWYLMDEMQGEVFENCNWGEEMTEYVESYVERLRTGKQIVP